MGKAAIAEISPAPKTVMIDPARVKKQADGYIWAEWFVRAPAGVVAGDLGDPAIWTRVQVASCSFRQFDRVTIVGHDEDWLATAIVGKADRNQAVLSGIKVVNLPKQFDALPHDENYRVVWTGSSYAVERKADGHRVATGAVSITQAERMMTQQYPTRV